MVPIWSRNPVARKPENGLLSRMRRGPEREKFVTAIATAQGYEPRYIRLDPHDNVAIVVNDLGLPAKTRFPCSLTEPATRFALSHPAMGTILVGIGAPQQFDDALAAGQKGTRPQSGP